ncbi:MAG: hypothetical protein NUV77_17350, partial [Thermoguttaceae bacterium]|nr:hypothetical protein [Thermoguttaceae bacterium]
LEWIVGDELSSDSLDIAPGHPDCDRSRPNPQYVTIPAIGVASPAGTVGLLWDVHQKWDGRLDRPRATFSSPDRLGNFRAHRMSLGVPSGDLAKAHDPSPKPYALAADKTLRLEFCILADGSSTDPLAAIDEYVRLYGIPRPAPLPRGSYEKEIEFSMQGYLKSLWVEDEKTWWTSKGGGIMSPKGRPPSYIADLLIGEILSPDPALRRACRERADEVARLIGIEPRLDAMRFPGRFDHGVAHPTSAAALLAGRSDDGSWRFDADLQAGPPFVGMDYYELGPDDAVEVGTCARKAFEVLRYARIAGDGETFGRMRKTLELMETFRVPRAAQVWEVPVHTPDILAAADAVDAYLEAYRFSGDARWLRDAVTWARRGLPFVYLWEDPEKPFLLGGSIPVFGATWYQGSWFARPVQWNGLRYAEALLKLADHDQSYPWRQIAQLLVHSAIHQQDAAGENAALWPDNISAIDSAKCPWVFAPRMILQSVLHLLGRDEEPNTVIVGQGRQRLHITSTARITDAAWDGKTCSFRATFPPGEEGIVLVSNVGRPTRVSIGPPHPQPLSR